VAAAASLLLVETPAADAAERGSRQGPGMLRGRVDLGPICPVEPCQFAANVFSFYKVVIQARGKVLQELKISSSGQYQTRLLPGRYIVDLDPNPWWPKCDTIRKVCTTGLGSANVPASVEIFSGRVTTFDIKVDLGMRVPVPVVDIR
jgi:hypothetical protein